MYVLIKRPGSGEFAQDPGMAFIVSHAVCDRFKSLARAEMGERKRRQKVVIC
jgi:hypothetical protein